LWSLKDKYYILLSTEISDIFLTIVLKCKRKIKQNAYDNKKPPI